MAVKNLSSTSRAMFEWYYPFGALVAFVAFFTFLGVVWVGYMIYMSRCKSRGSQSRQPTIYQAGTDGAAGDTAASPTEQGETTA